MNDGQIVFEITADDKKAVATVKSVTDKIEQESKKWDDAVKQAGTKIESDVKHAFNEVGNSAEKATKDVQNAADNMEKAMSRALDVNRIKDWAIKIAEATVKFGAETVNLASDLAEVQNVVDVTFGDSANVIQDWADKAGQQFGLTETQAKRFTSTIGAMMKSAGMSGKEIVTMSTDLAGLTADMASFYNMDFETAFQKIRSGISGETEPLKQLGINMSVANLQAYAMTQGITKAFDKMSQSEQVMLRYQYLMDATADAQGDFARTSDGYANSLRQLETNLTSLKTKIGEVLIDQVTSAINGINDVLGKLAPTKEKTLFDQINEIDVNLQTQLAEITKTSEAAENLIGKLGLIAGSSAGDTLGAIATGANALDASSPSTWTALLGSLTSIDGLKNIFSSSSGADNVSALAQALSGADVDASKAGAWKTFLGALSENADAVSKLTGTSVDDTKKWLDGLSESINGIDANDAEAWNKLLTTLVSGFSKDTPEGQQFMEGLAAQFLAMGSESEAAAKGLEALGFGADEITDKQEEWLKTCRELVRTIPGLSEVVNTETGEIQGGIGALSDYVDEWKTSQEKLLYWKAYYAKKNALAETEAGLFSSQMEAGGAQIAVENYLKNHPEIASIYNAGGGKNILGVRNYGGKEAQELVKLLENAKQAADKYTTAKEQSAQVSQQLANEEQWLKETIGEVEQAEADAADAAEDFGGKSDDAWKTAVTSAQQAIQALSDYYEKQRQATEKSIAKSVGGFDAVTSEHQKAEKKISDLIEKQNKLNLKTKEGKKEYEKLQKQIDQYQDKLVNPQSVKDGLSSQLAFMQQYLANLEKLRNMGVSNALLASLSDGSTDSADVLNALVQDSTGNTAREIDKQYQEVQKKREEFTNTLTDQQMTVDQTYQELAKKAAEAVNQLNMEQTAADNAGKTVRGVAQGIKDNVPGVESAVDAVLAQLNRLSGWGISIDWGTFGGFSFGASNTSFNDGKSPVRSIGKYETGLDRVPYDGFLASLHEGEGILTAEENRIWQRFKSGDMSARNVDYETLGGVMRDNVKAGGNVYLDGRVVGNVISESQAKRFKALERSGWQA